MALELATKIDFGEILFAGADWKAALSCDAIFSEGGGKDRSALRNVLHQRDGPSWAARLSRGIRQSRIAVPAAGFHVQAVPGDPQAVATTTTLLLPDLLALDGVPRRRKAGVIAALIRCWVSNNGRLTTSFGMITVRRARTCSPWTICRTRSWRCVPSAGSG